MVFTINILTKINAVLKHNPGTLKADSGWLNHWRANMFLAPNLYIYTPGTSIQGNFLLFYEKNTRSFMSKTESMELSLFVNTLLSQIPRHNVDQVCYISI